MSTTELKDVLSVAGPALLPLLLLCLSALAHTSIHQKPWLEYVHEVPPRLSLAATGILFTAALSPNSLLSVETAEVKTLASIILTVTFLGLYFVCERCYAAAKATSAGRWWTVLGGGLAYLLASFAIRCAQAAPGYVSFTR